MKPIIRLIGACLLDSRVREIFGNHSSISAVDSEETPDGTTRVTEPIVSFRGKGLLEPFLTYEPTYRAGFNGGNLFCEENSKFIL